MCASDDLSTLGEGGRVHPVIKKKNRGLGAKRGGGGIVLIGPPQCQKTLNVCPLRPLRPP